jgi:hypothetical protein
MLMMLCSSFSGSNTRGVTAPSPSLPNSGDPGATLARASLNFGDLTAVEGSGAAYSRMFPLRPIQIERLRSRVTLRARARLTP